jgi:hypothetical protein
LQPLSNRLSDHDVHLKLLLATSQMHPLAGAEAQLLIDLDIDWTAAFEVARSALGIGLLGDILNELSGVPLATGFRTGAQVDEVPGVVVALAQNGFLDVVQDGQEFSEETLATFAGQLVLEAPHAAADHGPEAVHILARRHPVFNWIRS